MNQVERPPHRRARLSLVLALLLTAIGLVAAAHGYLARRLILDPGVPEPWRSTLLGLLGLAFVSLLLEPVAERRLRQPWLRRACGPPLLWLGVLFVSVNVLLLSDGLIWLMGAAPASQDGEVAAGVRALGAVALVGLATAFGLRAALRVPPVRRIQLQLERWPRALDGFRIAQISDVHIGPILGAAFAEALAERVNALRADLVAVTGDLVDGSVERLRDEVAPLARLAAPHGVYFVTGNHDVYSGDEAWVAHFRALGLRPLRNERVPIGGAEGFDLAGVDDHRGDWIRGTKEDLPRALAGLPADRPVVLLAHDPTTFVAASRAGVDLQISGHTHGGQIWPFGWLVRLAIPFVTGLHRRGRSQLYVSRGSGFWGPPLRLLAPAEITEITLRRD